MTEKALPEIYREAADLVLAVGKTEGGYGSKACGFCTMGAVFEAAGQMDSDGYLLNDEFYNTAEFLRLASPVADQIAKSGRSTIINYRAEKDRVFWTIADWNDGETVGRP